MFRFLNKSGYIFTNKKNPKRGIMSTVLGRISVVSVCIAVYLTYRNRGDAPMQYGAVIVLSIIYAGIGLILGIRSSMEQDIFRFFPVTGILFNVAAMAACSFILYMGVV